MQAIQVHDRPLEFILAVPARRYSDFDELLAGFHPQTCLKAETEILGEFSWQGQRLIVAHQPELAAELAARGAMRALPNLKRTRHAWPASSTGRMAAVAQGTPALGQRREGALLSGRVRGEARLNHQGRPALGPVHLPE